MDFNLLQRAENGDAEAQYQLGMAYYNGEGVAKDDYRALDWFKKSAEANHAAANGMCGEFLRTGTATALDPQGAALYFTKGASLGDVFSQYRIGWIFWNTSNYNDAIPYLRQAADAGNASAKCLLGQSYFNGYGVPEDKVKALALFEEAAYAGDADAQYFASACYGFGYGTAVDVDQAYYYCKRSADQGHEGAIKNLSIFQNAQADPEAYKQQLRQATQSSQPSGSTSTYDRTSYSQPTHTPPSTSRYQPSNKKSDKKPGSWLMAIVLIIVFWPVGIWYILTHDLT